MSTTHVGNEAHDEGLREQIAAAMREHHLVTSRKEVDADGNAPCVCGAWHEPGPMGADEDDWDSHMADVALASILAVDDLTAPSHRAGLRDEIAAALEAADYSGNMRRGDLADAVLPVLYREWPWLRAEAEDGPIAELRRRVETLEHVAAGNKRHVQLIVPDLHRAADTIARVRRLCEMTIASSVRVHAVQQARDTLALLDGPRPADPRPDFTSPLTGTEIRRPCLYCGDRQMIPHHQYAEHVARLHPDVREDQPGVPVDDLTGAWTPDPPIGCLLPTQAALRECVAEALYDHDHPGWRVPLRHSDAEPAYQERAAAVVAVLDVSRQAPAEVVHPETNPQASESHTVDEPAGHSCTDGQQPSPEAQS